MTVSVKRSALAIAGPMFRPMVPASIVGITCIPKIALGLGSANSPSSSIRNAPVRPPSGSPSSAGWNSISSVPGSCDRRCDSTSATPSAMATCASCPQACFTPSTVDLYGTSISSGMGSASMSARTATTLPGRAAFENADHAGPANAGPDFIEPQRRAADRRPAPRCGSRDSPSSGCLWMSRRVSTTFACRSAASRSISARWPAVTESD